MADLQKEIDALDRVLFRLASVDDDRLLTVLDALLPQLLRLFPVRSDTGLEAQLKDKILQVIAHIKTRLAAIPTPRLPVLALAEILEEQEQRSVFAVNFAYMFIEMGFAAAEKEKQTAVLYKMARGLPAASSVLQETFFRLLISMIHSSSSSPSNEILKAADLQATEVVLDFLLDVVLYQPADNGTIYGLLVPRIERLHRTKVAGLKRDELYDCQLRTLQFVKALGPSFRMQLLHFIGGCASFHHAIKSFSEDQLRRYVNEDLYSSALEDASLCRDVMCLILSSQVAAQGRPMQGRDALVLGNRTRISDSSIIAATNLLKNSKAAANVVPLILQVICQLMYADEPTRAQVVAHRVKIGGVQLCEEVLRNCQDQYLSALLGPVILPTLLQTVMDPNADLDGSHVAFWREFRSHIYECISVLAARAPSQLTASEQVFQVLLVRCLVEEKARSGANALKAMNALRQAFATHGQFAVLSKIRSELIGLLKGTKLYEPDSQYQRVRVVVAEWTATVLHTDDDEASVSLRLALLKMCGDDQDDVRRASVQALLTEPLPTLPILAKTLETTVGLGDQYDLQLVMTPREAQECLVFLENVISKTQNDMVDVDDDQARHKVLGYFVDTLLHKSPDAQATFSVFEAALCSSVASQVIRLYGIFPEAFHRLLSSRCRDVAATISRVTTRAVLQRLARVLEWSLSTSTADEVANHLQSSLERVANTSGYDRSSALYTLAVAAVVYQRLHADASSTQVVIAAFSSLVQALKICLASVSNVATLPRGEEALASLFGSLHGAIDAVALTGPWNELLQSTTDDSVKESVRKLRIESIEVICNIVGWKVDGASADSSVKQKLGASRGLALEAIARITMKSQWHAVASSSLQSVANAVLQIGSVAEPELQFSAAQALIAIGTGADDRDEQPAYCAELVARIMREHSVSRQPIVRRSATIWLLSMCAAALSNATSPAWSSLFHGHAFASTLVEVHEFFVTMLNDSDPVTTECAVKGLAYLRLNAPSSEVGNQFSDSLFRRLRCFRAFTPTTGSQRMEDDIAEDTDDATPTRTQSTAATNASDSARPTPSSNAETRDTVENVAYREVSNVAADIGDPELMYSLLYLSTTNPIWHVLAMESSHDTTASSFMSIDKAFRARIIEQASRQWMSDAFEHRKRLIPWLFLLKNHSNSKVAEVMTNLWTFAKGELVTSTSQEKSLLAQQWDVILQFLLTKLEHSRNFKYREASCLALVDLLNGATADNLESSFARLWKLTARSVDDIMEAVAVAGLKLFKCLGEASLRIAMAHDRCRQELLDYLIGDGIVHKNIACRALCIDLLLRLIKEIPASAIEDRLDTLILKLLEYLSSLEMPELQYAQFHVEKKDQLERLRISLSQSGPVGQLLDQCTLKLKDLATRNLASCVKIVDSVARGVANLLKFGVGLNTRVGTANYTATLATELPFELKKCDGAEFILVRALFPYISERSASENDQYGDENVRYNTADGGSGGGGVPDAIVLQSYLRAAAYLCPLVEPSVVKRYVHGCVFAVHRRVAQQQEVQADQDPSVTPFTANDTYTSRYLMVSAMATKELVAKCPPIADATTLVTVDSRNDWYASHVFPAAFLGQYASSKALRAVWSEVLEDLPPRIKYSGSALSATLTVLGKWIRHPSWDTRRQGIKALQALFASTSQYRSKLTPHQTDEIWRELQAAVPGRLWRGKGAILEALAAIATVRSDEWQLLTETILDEADRAWMNHDIDYLESALGSLSAVSQAMPVDTSSQQHRLQTFSRVRTKFETWQSAHEADAMLPPMIIKVVFETLGSVFPSTLVAEDAASSSEEKLLWLCDCVVQSDFHVWSIRRSILTAMAQVVTSVPVSVLAGQHVANRIIDRCCDDLGVGDAKYSMIRIAAGDVLAAMAARQSQPTIAWQLTANRERIQAAVDVLRRSEEPKEQQTASRIFNELSRMVG